jgi:hypothetical protein
MLLACLLLPAAGRAEVGAPPEFTGIRVGFAGRYKAGLWTPVELTLRGGTEALSGRVRVWTADSDGVSCSTTTPEPVTQVLPGRETLVRLCVRFGHVETSLRAEFQVGDRTVAERTFETAGSQAAPPVADGTADTGQYPEGLASQALVVGVGPDSLGLEEAAALTKAGGEPRAVIARLDGPGSLPTQWYAYEGVDALVLSTSRPEVLSKLPAAAAQVEALDRWVRMGGTLLLCVGSQAGEVLREGAPLARFAPGRFQGVLSLPQAGILETYAKSQNPIPRSGPERGEIRAARLTGVRGKIEAAEADLPLVVRTPRGFGQVVFFAADLDQAPLSHWSDRKLLLARLLDLPAAETPVEEHPVRMHYGYADVAGQLRSALDRFAGVRLVPFFAVALLAVLYILCIGPGDYFFLRKFLPRMEWTWVTFPAVVLGLSGGAYLLAHWLKGDQLRVHQADLVDVDPSGSVRGTSWMNVFSPGMETFNLALAPRLPDGRPADAATMLTWLGLPGDGLGGMYQPGRTGAAGVPSGERSGAWNGRYAAAAGLDALQGVPIQVWSTKSFTARWTAQSQPGAIETSLVEESRVPRGTVTNHLDFPLCDCILAYDRYLYDLGTLEPGRPVEIGPATPSADLAEMVQGPGQALFGKPLSGRTSPVLPYDPASVDVQYILRAMTFFAAADGRRQTGLANDYQSFVDLSGLLRAGCAVLVACPGGRAPSGTVAQRWSAWSPHPGADLVRDGRPIYGPQDQRTTVLRFVLEVRPGGGP